MKEFCKSVYICRSYDEKSSALFLMYSIYEKNRQKLSPSFGKRWETVWIRPRSFALVFRLQTHVGALPTIFDYVWSVQRYSLENRNVFYIELWRRRNFLTLRRRRSTQKSAARRTPLLPTIYDRLGHAPSFARSTYIHSFVEIRVAK